MKSRIKIIQRGYYDTLTEKCAFVREDLELDVCEHQMPAPCKGKQGQGLWCEYNGYAVFIENENFVTLNPNAGVTQPFPKGRW